MCAPENLAVSVSAIGIALSQGRTVDELNLMSAVFTQLADTLATVSASRSLCGDMEAQSQSQTQELPTPPD